ncbi:F-box protein At4g22280-like [Carex rostrata]
MMNTNWCDSEKTDGTDRISSLPDDVLTHILSFLSTREAVQTCILSKRWINTWAFVPDLKFDIMEFNLPKFLYTREEMIEKFELLVKSVLEKRETSAVNKFQLRLDYEIHWPCTQAVANCIGDVMKLGPRECFVEMCSCQNLNLNTDLIFTCASLIDLWLYLSTEVYRFVAIEPNLVNLPCLKTLELYGVSMSDDSFKKLLLGCPVLEELVLQNCEMDTIEICSNTLKKLELYSLHDIMLHISAPNLLYLNIGLVGMREIMSLNTPSLVDASIVIIGWYDQDKYITMGPKLMHSLSNVESLQLELCFPNRKVQKKDFSSYPVFNNLKRLKLVCWCFYVFDLPPYFLHHSPKLEELTFTNIHAWVA